MLRRTMLPALLHRYYPLLNLIIFKLIWANSVLLKNAGIWITLVLITINLLLSPSPKQDLQFAIGISLLGALMDFALSLGGIYLFPGPFIPVWLILLWFAFAQTLAHGYRVLMKLPLILFCMLGAVAGPLSYLIGWKLGAVEFGRPLVITIISVAFSWALLMPLILFCNRYTYVDATI